MTVVFGVCANVLEDEGASGGNDEDFEHKVVKCLPEDPAEAVSLQRLANVVAESPRAIRERAARNTRGQIHFKLVTDAVDTCNQIKPSVKLPLAWERPKRS